MYDLGKESPFAQNHHKLLGSSSYLIYLLYLMCFSLYALYADHGLPFTSFLSTSPRLLSSVSSQNFKWMHENVSVVFSESHFGVWRGSGQSPGWRLAMCSGSSCHLFSSKHFLHEEVNATLFECVFLSTNCNWVKAWTLQKHMSPEVRSVSVLYTIRIFPFHYVCLFFILGWLGLNEVR